MTELFNNAVCGDTLNREFRDGFRTLADLLAEHCGPYATNAVVARAGRVVVEADTFTKDGITIVAQLLSDRSASARFIGRISRFLGSVTDKKCHDGTTTAMLLFALLCENYFRKQSTSSYSWKSSTTSYSDRKNHRRDIKIFERIHAELLKSTTERKLTIDDFLRMGLVGNPSLTRDDVVRAIAYRIAMIASKGDRAMSQIIADVVTSMQIETYGLFVKTIARNEQAERISKVIQPFQFELKCQIGSAVYNSDMNQKFRSPNAVVFSTHESILIDTRVEDILYHFLGTDARSAVEMERYGMKPWNDIHDGRHLVFITPQVNCYRFQERIERFNAAHPNNPIVVATSHTDPTAQVFMNRCLYGLRGQRPFADSENSEVKQCFLEDVDLFYVNQSLRFNNLFTPTGDSLNPWYRDPSLNAVYTEVREACEDSLREHVERPTESGLTHLAANQCIYYYRFLCCQQIIDVQIGGLIHDNQALQSVYEDAMGSAISAVTKGVVVDNFLQILREITCHDYGTSRAGTVWTSALEELLSTIHQMDFSKDAPLPRSEDGSILWDKVHLTESVFCDTTADVSVNRDLAHHDVLKDLLDVTVPDARFLIQPYVGALEQIKRIGDLVPKVINTTLLIDTGHIEHVEHRNDLARSAIPAG